MSTAFLGLLDQQSRAFGLPQVVPARRDADMLKRAYLADAVCRAQVACSAAYEAKLQALNLDGAAGDQAYRVADRQIIAAERERDAVLAEWAAAAGVAS